MRITIFLFFLIRAPLFDVDARETEPWFGSAHLRSSLPPSDSKRANRPMRMVRMQHPSVRFPATLELLLVGLCYLSNVGEEKVLNQQIHYIFVTLNIFVERKTHYIIPQTEQAT